MGSVEDCLCGLVLFAWRQVHRPARDGVVGVGVGEGGLVGVSVKKDGLSREFKRGGEG